MLYNCTKTRRMPVCSRLQDPVMSRIEERVSLWTKLPVSHQEDAQVLRQVSGLIYRSGRPLLGPWPSLPQDQLVPGADH